MIHLLGLDLCAIRRPIQLRRRAEGNRAREIRLSVGAKGLQAWFTFGKALALYRAGDLRRCVDCASRCKTIDSAGTTRNAEADLLIAMANERLHKHSEAIVALKRAQAITEKMSQPGKADLSDGDVGVENWLICQVLLREAKSLIGDAGQSAGPTSLPTRAAGE